MSKGETSCAVGRDSDGTGGCNAFWGKILATVPSEFKINRWRRNRDSEEDYLGEIGLYDVAFPKRRPAQRRTDVRREKNMTEKGSLSNNAAITSPPPVQLGLWIIRALRWKATRKFWQLKTCLLGVTSQE
jgi:hypothetical protein